MAQGLPLTTVAERCGDSGRRDLGSVGGCLTGDTRVAKTWTDMMPHEAAAFESAGCGGSTTARARLS